MRFTRMFVLPALAVASLIASAQDTRHGRKYKAPPETSHLEILVVKAANGKVLENAAVIFHPTKDGIDEGNLEVKSGVDGKAFIDVIPTGSDVQVQVIAGGFSTYAGTIKLTGPSHQLTVKMARPQEQVTAYGDEGSDLTRRVGIQEPNHVAAPLAAPKPLSADAPVLSLPAPGKGDAAAPADHNVPMPPSPPAKEPNNKSGDDTPATDGSPNTSSPSN